MVEAEHNADQKQARQQRHPRCRHQKVTAVGDQRAPFGGWRLCAEAEKAQPGSGQNRRAEVQRGEHRHRAPGVGQNVPQQGAGPAGAAQPRRFHIRQCLDPQHLGAGGAGETRNDPHAHRDSHRKGAETDGGDNRQRQQQAGQRQQYVDETHDHGIDAAPRKTGNHPKAQAAGHGNAHRQQRGLHRQAGAVHNAGIKITAQFVGAKPVRGVRRDEFVGGRGGVRRVAGQQVGCQRGQQRKGHQRHGEHEPRPTQQWPDRLDHSAQVAATSPLRRR
ncbi:hypothetical protein ALP64_201169 [Pseudomonas syringae pv. actinidiae]|nr:hypothetical protein ALP64_201169 [Pseudomonas syringae pv. actinidiae]